VILSGIECASRTWDCGNHFDGESRLQQNSAPSDLWIVGLFIREVSHGAGLGLRIESRTTCISLVVPLVLKNCRRKPDVAFSGNAESRLNLIMIKDSWPFGVCVCDIPNRYISSVILKLGRYGTALVSKGVRIGTGNRSQPAQPSVIDLRSRSLCKHETARARMCGSPVRTLYADAQQNPEMH
jgi:hypothetical protein